MKARICIADGEFHLLSSIKGDSIFSRMATQITSGFSELRIEGFVTGTFEVIDTVCVPRPHLYSFREDGLVLILGSEILRILGNWLDQATVTLRIMLSAISDDFTEGTFLPFFREDVEVAR